MFSEKYPNLAWWIADGWVELGKSDFSDSWVRVLDLGGMCWEDKDSDSLDEALWKAEVWASQEIEERFGEEPPKRYDETA